MIKKAIIIIASIVAFKRESLTVAKIFLFLFTLSCTHAFAQEKLIKDIDFDGKNDTVQFDKDEGIIMYQLSTKKFKTLHSLPIGGIEYASNCYIKDSKNGFEFTIEFGRYGVSNQFRYEKITKGIRLIGMRRRESNMGWYGANGASSVNLLTGKYIGNWQYNDKDRNEHLVEIPTIKSNMYFGKIYLEGFSDKVYNDYDNRCTTLFVKYKNLHKKKLEK